MVDFASIDSLIRNYATPVVGAALILAGIFLRLLGKGVSYLILGVGIVGTLYVGLREMGSNDATWVVGLIFLGGFAASLLLALAFRALTVAIEFGFFTVGWYLLLQALPTFLSSFPEPSTLTGASGWIGVSIVSTIITEGLMRRLKASRRVPMPAAPIATNLLRGARP